MALITGARRGIGAGVARHFASIGYGCLALVARNADLLEAVAEDCRKAGAKEVLALKKDLATEEGNREAVRETVEKFGREFIITRKFKTVDKCSQDIARKLMEDGTNEA